MAGRWNPDVVAGQFINCSKTSEQLTGIHSSRFIAAGFVQLSLKMFCLLFRRLLQLWRRCWQSLKIQPVWRANDVGGHLRVLAGSLGKHPRVKTKSTPPKQIQLHTEFSLFQRTRRFWVGRCFLEWDGPYQIIQFLESMAVSLIITASLCVSPESSGHVKWTEETSANLLNQQKLLGRGVEIINSWEVIHTFGSFWKQLFLGNTARLFIYLLIFNKSIYERCLMNWAAPFLLTWCLSKRRSSRWPMSGLNTKPAPTSSCQFLQYLQRPLKHGSWTEEATNGNGGREKVSCRWREEHQELSNSRKMARWGETQKWATYSEAQDRKKQ